MQVEKGEKVAVIGANGSGKSTLIKAILGEYEIKDGQILLFGKDMQQLRTEERGKEIGYCPSVNQLYSVSGEDNIKMALWGECEKAKQLKSLPLDSLTEKMSEGEKKRISITRAGAGRKLLIIADEPEASLNQELADKYMEWLLKQAETVVVVTHRKESLSGFTRIIYMEDLKG